MDTGSSRPLLIVSPIEPRPTGNGLAMRAAAFVAACRTLADVTVLVVPTAGSLPGLPADLGAPVHVVPFGPQGLWLTAALPADPDCRRLMDEIGPPARGLPVVPLALADSIAGGTVPNGAAVLVLRSYLGPFGLALARRIGAPWTALDLDDDDEAMVDTWGGDRASVRRLVAAVARRVGAVSLASPDDAATLAARLDMATHTVPNAVAVPSIRPAARPGSDRVLFVGNLTYPPNAAAAVDLAERVVPAVQRRLGRPVHLQLVGNHAADGPLPGLRARPGVEVTGWVPDLGPRYGAADVVVAPLAHGSGTRIKLLEAFAMGVPVVTTPVGAAGLAVRHGTHLLLGRSPEELAEATAAILGQAGLGDRLASAAFDLVTRRYSPSAMAAHVATFLSAAAGGGRPA